MTLPTQSLGGFLGLLVGAIMLVGAVSFFRARSVGQQYPWLRDYQRSAPGVTRNAVFGWVPVAGVLLIGGALVELGDSWPRAVRNGAALVALACLAVAIWALVSPPAWLKPGWFRREQALGFPLLSAVDAGQVELARIKPSRRKHAAGLALLLIILGLSTAVFLSDPGHLVGPVLIGLGVAIGGAQTRPGNGR
jgi:hypothetical protein